MLKRKKVKSFGRCAATIQNTRVFCARGAHDKYYRHDRLDWYTFSMPLREKLEPNECKNNTPNVGGTDSAELYQFSDNGCFTWFNRLSFQVQIERKTGAIHCKLFEHCTNWCVPSHQNNYDWITTTAKSKLRCKYDQESLIDENIWSKKLKKFLWTTMIN